MSDNYATIPACKPVCKSKLIFLTLSLAVGILGCTNNLVINEDICNTVNVYAAEEEKKYMNSVKQMNNMNGNAEEVMEKWCKIKKATENYITYLNTVKDCSELSIVDDIEGKLEKLNNRVVHSAEKAGPNCI
tara:strand:- start:356 stop:751 length:396 start_codon:yes stop_codon:yes gene_type:complete